MIIIYQLLSILLSPLIDLYLWFRKFNHKEDKLRFAERLGYASFQRPEGFLLWVHCASVGESNSVLPLVNEILRQNPQIHVLITSGTVTSAKEIAKKLPNRAIHQFVPVDKFFAVTRFINHWHPDFAMFVESEIWPNLVIMAKKSGCKLALVNGRISEKSYKNWQIFHKIGFNILKNFDLSFAQSEKDKERFEKLGLKNVYFEGNLKAVCPDLACDLNKLEELKKVIKNRKIWLAASTHKGEEEIIIQTHINLKKLYPDILTIIAPRHPSRKKEILALIPKDLQISVRSENDLIKDQTDIYLADSLGELGLFYNLNKIAFIGGSLKPNIGGHTPFEAMKLGVIPITGPYVDNFEEIYDNLVKNGACIMVKNQKDLVDQIQKLLSDSQLIQALVDNGSKAIKKNNDIIQKITAKLQF